MSTSNPSPPTLRVLPGEYRAAAILPDDRTIRAWLPPGEYQVGEVVERTGAPGAAPGESYQARVLTRPSKKRRFAGETETWYVQDAWLGWHGHHFDAAEAAGA